MNWIHDTEHFQSLNIWNDVCHLFLEKFTGFQWIKYEIHVPNNVSIDLYIELGRKSFRENQQQLQQKTTLVRG